MLAKVLWAWISRCNIFGQEVNWLQWRNRLAHGTYRQYKEICRGCEFEPHLEHQHFNFVSKKEKKFSPRPGIEPGPST